MRKCDFNKQKAQLWVATFQAFINVLFDEKLCSRKS